MTPNDLLKDAPLGKTTTYAKQYQADLLFSIPRQKNREHLGIKSPLPFHGCDIWNTYELSWLNEKGKPQVAGGEFIIPCTSPNLIESKSMKLYLNSFNNTRFDSLATVQSLISQDFSQAANAEFTVKLLPYAQVAEQVARRLEGTCIDDLDVSCDTYHIAPHFLKTEHHQVSESLYSDLLKSNCLMTNQPDWASIHIRYTGKKIQHEGLLQYLVSFRDCNEFAEQCVERIFMDISTHCQPKQLLVYARYTRRGGIDINPYRANYPIQLDNVRLWRQ
jgi:7-cyano-7-deazaguanine reductase